MHVDLDASPSGGTDPRELDRFAALAETWWDAAGPMAPLHRMGPVRVAYIRDRACARFAPRSPRDPAPLEGLSVLDVGCGGGLVAEPLARLGATVTGVDPSPDLVEVARRHAEAAGLAVRYEVGTAEALAGAGERFDVVLALEVVEHVPDVPAFLAALAEAARPGGLVVLSTLSRTLRSLLTAKLAVEYLLRWLPPGTHRWRSFLTPAELARHLRRAGLRPVDVSGVAYRADRGEFRLGRDPSVNYFLTAAKE